MCKQSTRKWQNAHQCWPPNNNTVQNRRNAVTAQCPKYKVQ